MDPSTISGSELSRLSPHAIKEIMNEGKGNQLLQILFVDRLTSKEQEVQYLKFKVCVSDGFAKTLAVFTQAAGKRIREKLITRFKHSSAHLTAAFRKGNEEGLRMLFAEGPVADFSVVKVNEAHVTRVDKGRKLMVVASYDPVFDNIREIIGNPFDYLEYEKAGYMNPAGSNAIPCLYMRNPTVSLSSENPKDSKYFKIRELHPLLNDWILKGRVIKKTSIKKFRSKINKTGEFFSIMIMDNEKNEIRATFFNSTCEKFLEAIQENRVYEFSKGQLKENDTTYKKKVDYNIIFDDFSVIKEIDDDLSIPFYEEQAMPSSLKTMKLNEVHSHIGLLDFFGIILAVGEPTEIMRRAGDVRVRRNLLLCDDTRRSINMSIWGNQALDPIPPHTIVLIKNVRVSFEIIQSQIFLGSLSFTNIFSTEFVMDEKRLANYNEYSRMLEFKESLNLQNYSDDFAEENPIYPKHPLSASFPNVSAPVAKSLQEIEYQCENLGMEERVFNVCEAQIVMIKLENLVYYSCPNDKCCKKVKKTEINTFECDNCEKEYPVANCRFVGQVCLSDNQSYLWASFYDCLLSDLYGKEALHFQRLKEISEPQFKKEAEAIYYRTLRLTLMSRVIDWQGTKVVRHQGMKAEFMYQSRESFERWVIGSIDSGPEYRDEMEEMQNENSSNIYPPTFPKKSECLSKGKDSISSLPPKSINSIAKKSFPAKNTKSRENKSSQSTVTGRADNKRKKTPSKVPKISVALKKVKADADARRQRTLIETIKPQPPATEKRENDGFFLEEKIPKEIEEPQKDIKYQPQLNFPIVSENKEQLTLPCVSTIITDPRNPK